MYRDEESEASAMLSPLILSDDALLIETLDSPGDPGRIGELACGESTESIEGHERALLMVSPLLFRS